jgi:fucose permease
MQNFGGNLGGAIAPVLTGLIADQTGSFSLALSLCGAILPGGVFAYLLFVSKAETVRRRPQAPVQ